MLSLESQRWLELETAYGKAPEIPALLAQLADLPAAVGAQEPWFSLWSALAHQGDVYSASVAAVPHVIAALARYPIRADSTYFQFPACVEICRQKQGAEIPETWKRPIWNHYRFCQSLSPPHLHELGCGFPAVRVVGNCGGKGLQHDCGSHIGIVPGCSR